MTQSNPIFPDDGAPPLAWSPAQLMRLENEWRRLQRMFAYHPHIRIVPLAGDPPDQYNVEYRIRTLVHDPAGQLQYANNCSVHIWLPPTFPHEMPLVRPISPLFHPNVVNEGIAINRVWTGPTNTLVDVVVWVGTLLAWQDYDADAPWNPTAVDWLAANPHLLPIDPNATLGTDAGGDALARICRFGPRSLEQIRAQLKQMCDSLLAADGAPSPTDTRSFAQRTRQSLNLFLEDDVPDSLRFPAAELDDFARELQESSAVWEALRTHRALADQAMLIARQLSDIEQSIGHESAAIDALATFQPQQQPVQLIRQIPPLTKLQLHQGNLVNLISRAEKLLAESRVVLDRYVQLPPIDISRFLSPLQKRLETERTRALETGGDARRKLNIAIAQFQPARGNARVYAQALHRAIDWRTYIDLILRGQELVQKVMDWSPALLQTVSIETDSGHSGPFDLEQTIKLPGRPIAVRNPAALILEILAADTGLVLARSDNGTAAVPVKDGQKAYRALIQLAGNCDEFAIQLDYLLRESSQLLSGLSSEVRGPRSWLGQTIESLTPEAVLAAVRADHAQSIKRWAAVRDDLRSLAPYRERIGTLRMVQRVGEAATQLASELAAEQSALKESTDRIGAIIAASARDLETGQLHIPARFATEYPQRLRRREQAKSRIPQLEALLEQNTRDIHARMDDPRLRGFADRPALLLIGALPDAWSDLEAHMSDAAIAGRLVHLEKLLDTKLIPKGFGAGGIVTFTLPAAADHPPESAATSAKLPPAESASRPPGDEGEFRITAAADEPESPPGEELIDFDPRSTDPPDDGHR